MFLCLERPGQGDIAADVPVFPLVSLCPIECDLGLLPFAVCQVRSYPVYFQSQLTSTLPKLHDESPASGSSPSKIAF